MTHRLLPILTFLLTVLTTGYGQVVPSQEPKEPGPGEDTLKVPITQLPQSLAEAGVTPPTLQNFLPLSSSSAAQQRYGEYPVSLFTGLPTISIPLYEIKTPRFALPLALSYHASGIKVADAATWVGLGWAGRCKAAGRCGGGCGASPTRVRRACFLPLWIARFRRIAPRARPMSSRCG